MSRAATKRIDDAATTATAALNVDIVTRDLYEAIIQEEASISELEQSMFRLMHPAANKGKASAAEQRAIKDLHNQQSTSGRSLQSQPHTTPRRPGKG